MWYQSILGTAVLMHTVAPAAAQTVPAALQQRVSQDPSVLAMMVAHASVPAGIVATEADRRAPAGRPDFTFPLEPRVSLDAFARLFNEQQQRYRATNDAGVLVLRMGHALPEQLQRPIRIEPMQVKGVMEALVKLLAPLDSRFGGPGGLMGSTMRRKRGDGGEDAVIGFDGTERRLVDGLNAIARQSGQTWVAIMSTGDEKPDLLHLGFLHRDGFATTVDVNIPAMP